MAHKVGDTVTVTRGPHKGDAHKVIHVHKDGRVNVKPHNKMPHQIKYRHGAATAKASEVRKMNSESVDEKTENHVRSNRAMHSFDTESEKKSHASHMSTVHGVKVKYHGNDEVSYHGPKKAVRKALGNHYGGDHDHAKEEHPHIYKESINEIARSMTPMRDKFGKSKAEKEAEAKKKEAEKTKKEGTIITPKGFKMKDSDKEKLAKIAKMLKRDKAVAKKSTNPGPNENQKAALMKKLAKSAQSSEKGKKAVTLKKAPFRIPSKDDMKNEACWDTHKQVGMKKKGGKMVPNCVPKNEGAMKRIATSQSSKPDRMAGKGLDTFKKKPPEKNEVLDKDKDHMSYRQKAKYSMDRARNSATAKIVRGKGDDIDKEKNTLRKRAAGMAMSDRKGVRQFRKFHGYDKKK